MGLKNIFFGGGRGVNSREGNVLNYTRKGKRFTVNGNGGLRLAVDGQSFVRTVR